MFCFQCSETMKGTGCTVKGVCGKEPEVANLQDLLIWILKGTSFWGVKAREVGINDSDTGLHIAEGLFTTITNVDFDPVSLGKKIDKALAARDRIEVMFRESFKRVHGKEFDGEVPEACTWRVSGGLDVYEMKGAEVGVMDTRNEDIRSLRELLTYGLKGIAAYTDHAYILKHSESSILDFLQEGMAACLDDSLSVDDYVSLVLRAGEYAVKAMSLLDEANTTSYGNPEITS
ncbi:MAG TPA: hydroxylamine reductase, partial [Mesotoga sp.]|nr:hydroxylamine reductase [Mesotoga sp.]